MDLGTHVLSGLALPPPDTMGQTFDLLAQDGLLTPELALRLRKAVGFRNLAVHAYQSIDWDIVFSIATRHLRDFEDFARVVAGRLPD